MMSEMQSIMQKIRNDKEILKDLIDKFYSEIIKVNKENTIPSDELFSMVVVKCVFEKIDKMCNDNMTIYHKHDLLGLLVEILLAHASFTSMIQKLINEKAKPKVILIVSLNNYYVNNTLFLI